MELNVIENKKNEMIFEIEGEDHTFCNALKQELWNDEHVKVASYNVDHPLISSPRFVVETDGKESAKDALVSAAKRLGKNAEKFGSLSDKELK